MNIWVIGGDRRQGELVRLLEEDGHTVKTFALEETEGLTCEKTLEELHRADCVILPLPALAADGMVNAPLASGKCSIESVLDAMAAGQVLCAGKTDDLLHRLTEERGLRLFDYFKREELAVANAVPTAEGAIQIAMEEMDVTLHCARALVIGYGRIGRVTPQRLAALGTHVSIAARSHEQLAWAGV